MRMRGLLERESQSNLEKDEARRGETKEGNRQVRTGKKRGRAMKRRMWLAGVLLALLWATPAKADNSFIIRTTLNLQALQAACNPPLLPSICTVVGGLGDPLGQLFLITSPLDLSGLLGLVGNPLGIVDAEVNQLLSLIGALNLVPPSISPTLMQDRSSTPYPAGSTTQT